MRRPSSKNEVLKLAFGSGQYQSVALVRALVFLLPVVTAFIVLTSPAWAAARCPVTLEGTDDPSWQSAAHRLENERASQSDDCARITVQIDNAAAKVRYESVDGRRAERDVSTPDDLASTVDALRVTGPVVSARPDPAPPRQLDEQNVQPQTRAPVADVAATRFGLGGGVRGGDERLFSPTLDGYGRIGVGHWDLGITGRWELGYRQLGDQLHRGTLGSGIAAGVLAGRREHFGPIDATGGMELLLASIDQEARERSGLGENAAHSEARVGAYIGAGFPARSSPRAYACLGAEFVPLRWGSTARDYRGAPVLPWWAASLAIGLEVGGP